jgi:hypothetical protein
MSAVGQVDADEQDALVEEGEVLGPHGLGVQRRRSAEVRLDAEQVVLPERPGLVRITAVGPLVVAGNDEGRDREQAQAVGHDLVVRLVAGSAGRLDVPEMGDEVGRGIAIVVEEVLIELEDLVGVVRNVGDHREREGLIDRRLRPRRDRHQGQHRSETQCPIQSGGEEWASVRVSSHVRPGSGSSTAQREFAGTSWASIGLATRSPDASGSPF